MAGLPPELATLLGTMAPVLWQEAKEQARKLRVNRGWKGPFAVLFDPRLTHDRRRLVDENGRWGRFCHALVHNSSTVSISGCLGTLRSISRRTEDGRFVPEPDYKRRLQLRWANVGSLEPIEIEGNDMARLDLCYTVEGYDELRFAVPRGAHGIRTDYGPGIYKVTVRVEAPGTIPTDESFVIVHDGNWETTTVRQEVPEGINRIVTRQELERVIQAERRYTATLGTDSTEGGVTGIASRGALGSDNTQRLFTPGDAEDDDSESS